MNISFIIRLIFIILCFISFGCKKHEASKILPKENSATIAEVKIDRSPPPTTQHLVNNVLLTYENDRLARINCQVCWNNVYSKCNSCFGTGQGTYEPRYVRVRSYTRSDGTRVRSHRRSYPGTISRCYDCNGRGVVYCPYCHKYRV